MLSPRLSTEAAITILRIDDITKTNPPWGEEKSYQQAYADGSLKNWRTHYVIGYNVTCHEYIFYKATCTPSAWIFHMWMVFDSWIVPDWSLNIKQFFRIGLIDQLVEPKNKQFFRIGLVISQRAGAV